MEKYDRIYEKRTIKDMELLIERSFYSCWVYAIVDNKIYKKDFGSYFRNLSISDAGYGRIMATFKKLKSKIDLHYHCDVDNLNHSRWIVEKFDELNIKQYKNDTVNKVEYSFDHFKGWY